MHHPICLSLAFAPAPASSQPSPPSSHAATPLSCTGAYSKDLPRNLGTGCTLYQDSPSTSARLTSPLLQASALMALPALSEPALLVHPSVALARPFLHSTYHYLTDTGRGADATAGRELRPSETRRGDKPEPGTVLGAGYRAGLYHVGGRQTGYRNKTNVTQRCHVRVPGRGYFGRVQSPGTGGSQRCDEGM